MDYFLKSVRAFPDVYDLCMEHRDRYFPNLTANEYLARRYIIMALDEGETISQIQKEVPKKLKHMIADTYRNKLSKPCVAWTPVTKHLDMGAVPYDTMRYLQLYNPVGFRGVILKPPKIESKN